MKIRLLVPAALLLLATSCKKADTSNSTSAAITIAAVNSTVMTGNWRVSSFIDNSGDETANFAGYSFVFNSAGGVTAVKGGVTVNGLWAAGNDDSQVKLFLTFSTPAAFADLSNDWHITERTDTKIKMEDVSGGGGGTELLSFERN